MRTTRSLPASGPACASRLPSSDRVTTGPIGSSRSGPRTKWRSSSKNRLRQTETKPVRLLPRRTASVDGQDRSGLDDSAVAVADERVDLQVRGVEDERR